MYAYRPSPLALSHSCLSIRCKHVWKWLIYKIACVKKKKEATQVLPRPTYTGLALSLDPLLEKPLQPTQADHGHTGCCVVPEHKNI